MIAHYDEEELLTLLDGGGEADPHLTECSECRDSLDEFRLMTASLADASVWEPRVVNEEPNRQTIANLRAFADAQRTEDEAALPLVAELLTGPREEWMPRLQANDNYRTAGVVRKLMEASDKAIDVMPPDALEISALATEIADKLDPERYPSDTVMKLRGNAWRDRGYCLYQSSEYRLAFDSLVRAEALLRNCEVAEFDRARLCIAMSLARRVFDDFAGSAAFARDAKRVFGAYGDISRSVSASIAEAQCRWKSGDVRGALDDLLPLLNSSIIDADTQARLLANIAHMYRDSGNVELAIEFFEAARFTRAAIDENATAVHELFIQWSIAVLLGRCGKRAAAEPRILRLIESFRRLGMFSESIQAGLELAEFYLEDGKLDAAEMLCRSAVDFYARLGVASTSRAMTAIAFLREAAARHTVSVPIVRHVRSFFSGLSSDPELIFLPLPE